ncbi:hypothetical protein [Streptomyces sp. XY533]|uniref:hypothetical protein n=1 Tax=Streptomyces sp. XY533 TaxID=1519481 RepID=UPI0006ADE708|nr:hypothetical protein [Streptomyces sp. XY533]KOV07503.1 hypothetical protein ADK92_05660 [Streptomyces sp. XY533]
MSSDNRTWEERNADLRRREALDAPKIAAAEARADEIRRAAREAKEVADKKAAADLAAEQEERRRKTQGAKLDRSASKAVRRLAILCFLVALPLQMRAFWDPQRPWNLALPLLLETAAWGMLKMADAAIVNRRIVWPHLVMTGVFASIAAAINIADGFLHPEIGAVFGLCGGVASLAGPGVWVVHKFSARSQEVKATRAERKIAEAAVRQAEIELAAKQVDADSKRQIEADKRAAHEAKVAADKAAADAEITAQDEQRQALYPGAWEQYTLILAAHPLGSISRDRAWDEARRADAHPDVWTRYQIMALNAPANTKSSDLWAEAWTSEKGLPLGHTIEGLAAKLAAREYVEQTLAEHLGAAEHLAVEELLADIFGPGGEGGASPAKGRPRKPSSGPAQDLGALGGIGKGPDSAPARKDLTEPLSEADLKAARELRAADPDGFSTPAVADLLGRSRGYAKRIRDAVNALEGEQ